MSEYATQNQTPEEYQAEQDALIQREEVLKIFPTEELLQLKEEAIERLNDAEQTVHAINHILDNRHGEL